MVQQVAETERIKQEEEWKLRRSKVCTLSFMKSTLARWGWLARGTGWATGNQPDFTGPKALKVMKRKLTRTWVDATQRRKSNASLNWPRSCRQRFLTSKRTRCAISKEVSVEEVTSRSTPGRCAKNCHRERSTSGPHTSQGRQSRCCSLLACLPSQNWTQKPLLYPLIASTTVAKKWGNAWRQCGI